MIHVFSLIPLRVIASPNKYPWSKSNSSFKGRERGICRSRRNKSSKADCARQKRPSTGCEVGGWGKHGTNLREREGKEPWPPSNSLANEPNESPHGRSFSSFPLSFSPSLSFPGSIARLLSCNRSLSATRLTLLIIVHTWAGSPPARAGS